jgi:uncharacterized protein YecA (UPF0149 family)
VYEMRGAWGKGWGWDSGARTCLRENQDGLIRYADAGDKQEIERVKRLNAEAYEADPPALSEAHIGRNDPCPCGSGKKYKKCCGR